MSQVATVRLKGSALDHVTKGLREASGEGIAASLASSAIGASFLPEAMGITSIAGTVAGIASPLSFLAGEAAQKSIGASIFNGADGGGIGSIVGKSFLGDYSEAIGKSLLPSTDLALDGIRSRLFDIEAKALPLPGVFVPPTVDMSALTPAKRGRRPKAHTEPSATVAELSKTNDRVMELLARSLSATEKAQKSEHIWRWIGLGATVLSIGVAILFGILQSNP